MKRILEIATCGQCCHSHYSQSEGWQCLKEKRELAFSNWPRHEPPDWCPLPMAEKPGERIPELERRGVESTRIASMQAEVGSMALQVADLKRQRDELHAALNRELERRRAGDWQPLPETPQ